MSASPDQTETQKPQDPPGSWLWNHDPRIVYHAVRTFVAQSEWAKKMAASAGCPVFKAEPGWHALIVTDNAAATHVFNAPPDEFDRDEGFMNSNFDYQNMLDGSLPAIMAPEGPDGSGPHRAARAFIKKVLAARGFDAFAALCSQHMDGKPDHVDKPELPLADALSEGGTHLMFQWYLGLDGLPGKPAQDWTNGMLYSRGDSFPSNLLIAQLKKRPNKDLQAYSKTLLDAVRGCKYYAEYVGFANDVGMPEKDVAPNLLMSCLLNACSPTFAVGQPAVAQLYADPALRARLAAEVNSVSDAAALAELPLLDAFFVESMRFFGKPTRTSRKAVRDTTLTTADGRVLNVKKGMSVQIIHSGIRDDKHVLADPEQFRPDRFVENPELKRKMFTFGAYDTRDKPTSFHCPGAEVGVAQLLWKMALLPFIKDGAATIKEKYEIRRDDNGNNCTEPKDLTWVRSK